LDDEIVLVPAQIPPWQISPDVQALPSSHAALFGAFTQPSIGSQESSVHGLSSSQFAGVHDKHDNVVEVLKGMKSIEPPLLFGVSTWSPDPPGAGPDGAPQ